MKHLIYLVNVAYNRPFLMKFDKSTHQKKFSMGVAYHTYNVLYEGEECEIAVTNKLHNIIESQESNDIYVYIHSRNDSYFDTVLQSDYFKLAVYDVLSEKEFEILRHKLELEE